MPEIHRVADVTIRPVLHDAIGRHTHAWTAAAKLTAKTADQPILQIAPGEQRKPRGHNGELLALPHEFEYDHKQRAKKECLHRGSAEPANQPQGSHGN